MSEVYIVRSFPLYGGGCAGCGEWKPVADRHACYQALYPLERTGIEPVTSGLQSRERRYG
jgi:hypothetical protein